MTVAWPWWRGGVLYEIYVRSFADSDGDGIGDLTGILEQLDYLAWLGVDGLWLTPTTPSPNADWGYDVADYTDIDPAYGDLATLDRLVAEARKLNLAILVELVPNHTSMQHPWFLEARASRTAPRRDWYVWADARPDGSPPNNWLSSFGGPAWTLDSATGQFYLHNFLPEQPDLNWWNADVRRAFDDIMKFWLDRGASGFRIDVAHGIVKDRQLRDNPPVDSNDPEFVRQVGQRPVYNMNRPEVHEILRRWRTLVEKYEPSRALLGETFVADLEAWAAYYGEGTDELHLAFNFPFALAPFSAEPMRGVVARSEALLAERGWPVWTGSNHDIGRFPTRWCAGREDRIRCALMVLLTLRGTPVLYYGDEIGMVETPVPEKALRDPLGKQSPDRGRDPGRTPMHWHRGQGAGFTDSTVEPWLPIGDPERANVADQRADPASILHLSRDLISLRRVDRRLRDGSYRELPSSRGTWLWQRDEGMTVAVNLSDARQRFEHVQGAIAISTWRDRDGEVVSGSLELRPWEGVVVADR